MDSSPYPYATFEKEGYQLAVVDSGDTARVLSGPLPTEGKRFAVQPGDIVKLVFEYRDSMVAVGSGAEIGAEHMWVKVTEYGDGCLIGSIDSSPQYTRILKSGDLVAFHPKHIVAFWN